MKFAQRFILSLVLCSLGAVSLSSEALAANKKPASGMPGRRVGAGVRNDVCLSGPQAQVAIMPNNNIGLTAKAKPTLLFYLPEVNPDSTIEFVLQDENYQVVYDQTVTTHGDAGIIRLDLAASDAADLTPGQNYRWYFSVICNADDRSQDITSHGWIRRVETVTPLPQAAAPEDRLQASQSYARAGLWLDAFAEVDKVRRSQAAPPQATALWKEWLLTPTIDLPSLSQTSSIASPFTDGQ